MAAPTPPQAGSIETEDIHGRLQSFLEVDTQEAPVDPSTQTPRSEKEIPPEESEEPLAAAPDEAGEEPEEPIAAEAADEVDPEAPEAEPEGEDRGINTLADLAREFEMPEEDFLNHLEVEGPNGTVTLASALESFRIAPEAADRWHQIQAAEERLVAMDQQLQAQGSEQATQLAAHTKVAIDIIQAEFGNVNWQALEQEDPTAYLIMKQKQQDAHGKIAAAVDALKRMENQRDTGVQTASAGQRQREMEVLHRKMPDWKKQETAAGAMTEVQNFLVESGFNQEEINGLVDHRFLLVAYQAAKFHQLQKQAPKKIEKLKRLPSTRGSLKSSARRGDDRNAAQKQHNARVSNLKRTGSDMDAAALMEALID
jgi:hypothetical protein